MSTRERPSSRFLGPFDHTHLTRLLGQVLGEGSALAAVAYVSRTEGLPLGPGDILVCDASEASAKAGSTNRFALRDFLARGVEIWSVPGLHAKVVVAGGTAVVGSANWSERSATKLVEAAIESSDPAIVENAAAFVRSLAKPPSVRVDRAFLARMPDPPPSLKKRGTDTAPQEPRHWLVTLRKNPVSGEGLQILDGLAYADGDEDLDDGHEFEEDYQYFVWMTPTGPGWNMGVGDTIMMMDPYASSKGRVYPAHTIAQVVQGERAVVMVYRPNQEPDRNWIALPAFLAMAERLGMKRVSKNSNREISGADYDALRSAWPTKDPRRHQTRRKPD